MKKSAKEKSVIVSLWSAGSCGRRQLAGILRYINAGHSWKLRIIMDPKDFTVRTIRAASRTGVDGFIAFAGKDAAAELASLTTPTVLLSFPTAEISTRRENLSIFLNDNEAIGRKAADYFLSLGTFATYAFVPDAAGRGWSALRERSFTERLRAAGHAPLVYTGDPDGLACWLKRLPRPIAVMAPFDFGAREVMEACRQARLAVPKDVSVIGVDNDELICESTLPMLTSIDIDQERIGFRAAETLDRLMSARRARPTERVIIDCGRIVERESSRSVSPTVTVARRIQAFIDEHFREGLTVSDIAARLGISRRLADLRFTESTGRTIRSALEERRLDEIRRLLTTTDLPIARITRLVGYRNDLWIKYVFKKRHGQSMSVWRKQPDRQNDRGKTPTRR